MRRRAVAAVAAPLVMSALAVGGSARAAGAATGDRTDSFTFTSDATGRTVSCSVSGSFSSTQRSSGSWALTATVGISDASSSECYDGIAHLVARERDGTDDEFSGGRNFVQVSTTTPTEVTGITYEMYFDGCTCYSPEYTAPK